MDAIVIEELIVVVILSPIAIFFGLKALRYSYRGMVHISYYFSLKKENSKRSEAGLDPLPYNLKFDNYKYDPDNEDSDEP